MAPIGYPINAMMLTVVPVKGTKTAHFAVNYVSFAAERTRLNWERSDGPLGYAV